MKSPILVLAAFFLTMVCCHQQVHTGKQQNTPACIVKKIEQFSKESCPKGPNVKEYTFQGKTVFVFDQGSCGNDMTSEVLDANCNSLGYLGGFTGNVKINGEDFSNALLIRTVWEK